MSLYQCPCCDYFSLDDRGEYSICSVCFWEDSGWDVDCPDKYSGP
ncbi:CPCC family cysteine-rich protein, partial [Comamonas sp.]